jgi:hypothetical protein
MSQTPSINGSHMLGFSRRTTEDFVTLPAVELVLRTNRTAIRVAPAMKADILKSAEGRRAASQILNSEISNLHHACRDYPSRTASCSDRVFYQTNPFFQATPWKTTKTLGTQRGRKRPDSFFTKRSHSNPCALRGIVMRPAVPLNYQTNPLGKANSESSEPIQDYRFTTISPNEPILRNEAIYPLCISSAFESNPRITKRTHVPYRHTVHKRDAEA